MVKKRFDFEVTCKICGEVIGGISEAHAKANLKLHEQRSKFHKRFLKLKKGETGAISPEIQQNAGLNS